ncbi:MAG: hypothetical protein ABI672_20595 [Vicinamibacteria bacterium]
MSHDGLGGRTARHTLAVVSLLVMSSGLPNQTVHAGPPVITMTPSGVRIQAASSTLAETIDALSKAAGFKLTYDGARPAASLFNLDIDTPNLSQTLVRLLEGQNLNYAMLMDKSGTKVTSLMILGLAPKGASTLPGGGSSRPGAFSPPRSPKNDLPPVDDDPAEVEAPTPTPTPAPTPAPVPLSPFAPRSPFGSPFPPRPRPSATPSA